MTTHAGPIIAQRDSLTIIQCLACGWAHLDPLPDAAALDAYYASDFWQTTKHGWREQYEAQRDWLDMRHNDWLTLLETHVAGIAGVARRSLLDVGCGWGHFLEAARARPWQVTGIEPNEEANAAATQRLLTVHQGTWENFDHPQLPPWQFDAITAFWLLEHLPDPVAFLTWAREHLAQGGALMLAVPQEWTSAQQSVNDVAAVKNYWLDPTHLHYWHRETLFALLARCGFQVVDALATFPVETWLLDGHDYTADPAVGAEWHAKVRAAQLGQDAWERMGIARSRADNRMGRDLIVVAKVEGNQ